MTEEEFTEAIRLLTDRELMMVVEGIAAFEQAHQEQYHPNQPAAQEKVGDKLEAIAPR